MKHGPSLKSPFVQRVVDLNDVVEQKEIMVAQEIIRLEWIKGVVEDFLFVFL